MRKATAIGIGAGAVLAVGGSLTVWTSTTLGSQGAWSSNGIDGSHLDFTLAAFLLIGVALLITGAVFALAAVAEFWIEKQDFREAQVEARRQRTATTLEPTRPDPAHRIAH